MAKKASSADVRGVAVGLHEMASRYETLLERVFSRAEAGHGIPLNLALEIKAVLGEHGHGVSLERAKRVIEG